MRRAMSDGRQQWPRSVRVRLAWAERLVHRRLAATIRVRLVHPAFLSRLSGAQMFGLASVYQRGSWAAREMWMDFVAPADGGEPRSIVPARTQGRSTVVGRPHASISAAPATTITTTVQHVFAREIVRPAFSRSESIPPRVADVSAVRGLESRLAGAPPWDRVERRARELPPILFASRPALPLSAIVVRREVLPAPRPEYRNAPPTVPPVRARRSDGPVQIPGRAVPEPSLVDRLYASAEHGAALEPLSLRVFAPSPMPEAPAPAASPEGGSQARPYASPPAAVQTRLTRAEIDLVANRVATLLARRDRLARESKGIV